MSDASGEGRKTNETELDSKQLNIQYKRYYVDVKQNQRGRFIKIAEMGTNYKSRLVLSMAAAVQVRDQMDAMIAYSEGLPEGEENTEDGGVLKSETLSFETRRYYLDLKENSRGRFLRIAQTVSIPRVSRSQVAIPATGMREMRDTISTFIDKYAEGYLEENGTDKARTVQAENKTFYFDIGENDRGQYVRVSEVKNGSAFRTAITIPSTALEKIRDALNDVIAECKEKKN